jgi:hypothetical protein
MVGRGTFRIGAALTAGREPGAGLAALVKVRR